MRDLVTIFRDNERGRPAWFRDERVITPLDLNDWGEDQFTGRTREAKYRMDEFRLDEALEAEFPLEDFECIPCVSIHFAGRGVYKRRVKNGRKNA